MSGLAGIYNLDGRPVDTRLLDRMIKIIAHRGPDGSGRWIDGSVGVGHRMLHATPESRLEKQPLTDESGTLCLTLDGRVDNRQELGSTLLSNGWSLRDDSDAELVLRSYQCWGEECPVKILGDFAFAIWDSRRRRFFCARDIMGIKPFYYCWDGRTFRFASELRQILEDPAVRRKPNEGMIAECLGAREINLRETVYHGIFQLPRAHWLVAGADKVRTRCYWEVERISEIRLATDQEYAEKFFEIFKEAVRCRLRSNGPVASELSGGLDSSSIVSVAQWLFQQGAADYKGFETFSMVFPGQPWDESDYIKEVVHKWDLKTNPVLVDLPPASAYAQQARDSLDLPLFPASEMFNTQMASVKSKGARTLLTGDGGDQWLIGSRFHSADLLRRLRLLKVVQQVRSDSSIMSQFGTPLSPTQVLLRHGVLPAAPKFVRKILKRVVRGDRSGVPPWVGQRLARETLSAGRCQEAVTVGTGFATIAQREYLPSLLNFPWYSAIDRYISRFSLEYRHPFMDRRVIEYCLAIPPDQIRRRDQTKFVLRQAMKGFLPEMVRGRRTKPRYGIHTYWSVLEGLGREQFFNSLGIASLEWVDGKKVQQMYEQMRVQFQRNDLGYETHLGTLWCIAGIELWYRASFINVDGQPSAALAFTANHEV